MVLALAATVVVVTGHGAAAGSGAPAAPASEPSPTPAPHSLVRIDPSGAATRRYGPTAPGVDEAPGTDPATPTAPTGEEDGQPFRFDATPGAGQDRNAGPALPVPEVRYGEDALPPAVARARDRLLAAAATGDVEALRPIFADGKTPPIVAFSPVPDPVAHLRGQSGDPEGREILAILIELLSAGWVRIDADTTRETYVWPYFAHVPLAQLTPAQEVELYKILTAVDVEEMETLGEWAFYRVGIAPDGTIRYFSAEGF